MSVHPKEIASSVSVIRFSDPKKLNGIKNNKAPKSIEANVLQVVVDVGNKQGMSICLMRSKVNLSSTKYEKTRLKLHFLSTNSHLISAPQAITEDLGKKNSRLLQDGC